MTTRLLKIAALALLVSITGCEQPTQGDNSKVPNLTQPKESEGPRLDEAVWEHYGNKVAAAETTATASEMVADPNAFVDLPILMRGTVQQVCQSSGCWIELSDGTSKVFVDTRHKIELPRDCAGTEVVIEGTGATRKKPRSEDLDPMVIATGIALKKAE